MQEFKVKQENKFSRTYKLEKSHSHTGPQLKQQTHSHKHSPIHNHNHTLKQKHAEELTENVHEILQAVKILLSSSHHQKQIGKYLFLFPPFISKVTSQTTRETSGNNLKQKKKCLHFNQI